MGRFTVLIGFVALLLSTAVVSATEPIGRVKEVGGSAYITSQGTRSQAQVADPVLLGDVLETAADGSLGVTFADESRLSLGPDTTLTVDEYVYAPDKGEGSFVSRLTRGTLLYVSGLIAKLSPESDKVETPVGTIGIRGTRFLIELRPTEEP